MRKKAALTKERIVTFDVATKELAQLCGLTIAGTSSLFLLSTLGVAGEPRSTNTVVSQVGGVSFALVFILEVATLVRMRKAEKHVGEMQRQRQDSDRTLNSGELSEGMSLGGLV